MTRPTLSAPVTPIPQLGQDAETFDANMNSFLPELVTMRDENTALSVWTEAQADAVAAAASAVAEDAAAADGSATAAAASAGEAQAAAAAAAITANVVPWVAGAYTLDQVARSPADGALYICILAHTGATDPSADPTNWALYLGSAAYRNMASAGDVAAPAGKATVPTVEDVQAIVDASAVPSFQIGDLLTTIRDPSASGFLALDGAAHLKASYPTLTGLLGTKFVDVANGVARVPVSPAFSATRNQSVEFSPTTDHVVFLSSTGTKLEWGKVDAAGAFTALTAPATQPAGTPAKDTGGWSPDGVYFAVPSSTTPYIQIYKRVGDTLTKLADPATLPTGTTTCAAWSPDGTYLAVGGNTAANFQIYKRSGDNFDTIISPDVGSVAGDLWWGADGDWIAIPTASNFTTYSFVADTLTRLSTTAGSHGTFSSKLAISPDRQTAMSIFSAASYQYFRFLRRVGDSIVAEPNAQDQFSQYQTQQGKYSPDGEWLALPEMSLSGRVLFYKVDPATGLFVDMTVNAGPQRTSAGIGANYIYNASWSRDRKFVATGGQTTPHGWIIDTQTIDMDTQFSLPAISAEMSNDGSIATYIKAEDV